MGSFWSSMDGSISKEPPSTRTVCPGQKDGKDCTNEITIQNNYCSHCGLAVDQQLFANSKFDICQTCNRRYAKGDKCRCSKKATVYYWKEHNLKAKGHIALDLEDERCYISFYPDRTSKGLAGRTPAFHISYEKEKNDFCEADETLAIYNLKQKKIKKWFLEGVETHKWSLTYNCSDVVYQALLHGSEEFNRKMYFYGFKTPKLVWDMINRFERGIDPGSSSSLVLAPSSWKYLPNDDDVDQRVNQVDMLALHGEIV